MNTLPLSQLESALNYQFAKQNLLLKALTHRSYRYETDATCQDNQRLEFLGDAILGMVAADYLFHQFTFVQEGLLTRMRSSITNSATLARIARKLEVGSYLLLGIGERKSGGAERDSNLTDALESIIGAMYLDGGIPPVTRFFNAWFIDELHRVLDCPETDNPKGFLQEYSQKYCKSNPEYVLLEESGPAHAKMYHYEVHLDGSCCGAGQASSKQQAQINAAHEAVLYLMKQGRLNPYKDILVQESEKCKQLM